MLLNEMHDKLIDMGAKLVGSRYMDFDTPESDWDYLMVIGEDTYQELWRLGFETLWDESYGIKFVDVLRLNDDTLPRIEVQLVASVEVFTLVANTYYELKQQRVFKQIHKPLRKFTYIQILYRQVLDNYFGSDRQKIMDELEYDLVTYQYRLTEAMSDIYNANIHTVSVDGLF